MVIDVHQEFAFMSEWSSIGKWGIGILPILEQHQQIAPPDLAIFLEAHGSVAPRLLGAFQAVCAPSGSSALLSSCGGITGKVYGYPLNHFNSVYKIDATTWQAMLDHLWPKIIRSLISAMKWLPTMSPNCIM